MSVTIRKANAKDVSIIVDLVRELAQNYNDTSPITPEYVRAYLASDGCDILIAEENSQPLGLLSYSMRPNLYHAAHSCLIEELIVTNSAQRKGVGKALIQEVVKECDEFGCAEISVSTMLDNERAIKFYKSLGFTDEALFLERHF